MVHDDPRAALDWLVQESGESFAALSRMIGRNDAYLQQFVRRGSPRRLAEADRRLLAAYFRVEEAVLGGPTLAAPAPQTTIRRLEVPASAGPGTLAEADRFAGGEAFDPRLLARLGVRAVDSAVLRAQGDSMAPTIEDGDLMLVNERDRRVRPRGAIFVLRLDGALFVKRIARGPAGLAITSDNPVYPPITAGEVEIMGRVVWLSRALA